MPRLLAELHQAFTGDSMRGGARMFPAHGEDGGTGSQKRSNEVNGENEEDPLFFFSVLFVIFGAPFLRSGTSIALREPLV
jgi:hypothetical protein